MPLDPEAIRAAARAAEAAADMEDVGEYGYGGEIFPHNIVTNWEEVVEAAIREYIRFGRASQS